MEIMKGNVYVSTSTPVQDNRITGFVKRQELWGHKPNLPEWTQTLAVIVGFSTVKVTVLDTCAPLGCQCGCVMTA